MALLCTSWFNFFVDIHVVPFPKDVQVIYSIYKEQLESKSASGRRVTELWCLAFLSLRLYEYSVIVYLSIIMYL